MYDEDYLYFFAAPGDFRKLLNTGLRSPALISPVRLPRSWPGGCLDMQPGMSVLDLACGHGELANRLAARGCLVTGLDSSAVFLDPCPRRRGRRRGHRRLRGRGHAPAAVDRPLSTGFHWSTAFGYFDDAANRAVLDGIVRALQPGGRLAMDLDNLTAFLAYCAAGRAPDRRPPDGGGAARARAGAGGRAPRRRHGG